MNDNLKIYEIFNFIRKDENYVPRNYQTIGGMWTIDTWKLNDITIQLGDEGYTKSIITNDLNVYQTNDTVTYLKGNSENLKNLYDNLFKKEN